MKQTPRIREYCESLARHPEYPTDSLLHAFVGGQSLARMVEEKLSLNGSFAWDSLSSTIDEECARTKADLAPHGLFVNGPYWHITCYVTLCRTNLDSFVPNSNF